MKQTILLFISFLYLQSYAQNGGTWTWIHGDSTYNISGNFGTKGVSSPNNLPPGRYHPAYWQDLEGNFWIFGNTIGANFADMWKYNPITNEWTWISGSNNLAGTYGNYGTKGIPSVNNYPKNRGYGASCWVDSIGDLWMYGGSGCTDLWRYHIPTNEWTWVDGSNPNVLGIKAENRGIKNISNSNNFPGPRSECKSNWVFNNDLILFGGEDNEVWSYSIANHIWTWIGGGMTPSKGSLGVPNPNNCPEIGPSYCKWQRDNKLYLFGGAVGNDVWSFNLTTKMFTWELGPTTPTPLGIYPTTNCIQAKGYFPSSRIENHTIQSSKCNSSYWTFGGFYNYSSNITFCDLWLYYLDSNYWIKVSGNNPKNYLGCYGIKGKSNPINHPPSKGGMAIWNDKRGNLYLFGGYTAINSGLNLRNDLWKFEPDVQCLGKINILGSLLKEPSKKVICDPYDSVVMNIDSALYNIHWSPLNKVSVNTDSTKLVFKPTSSTEYSVYAQGGCTNNDSIHLKINIGQHTYDTIYDTACAYLKYPYGSNGIYNYKIPNSVGCDSIIELHLTIDKRKGTNDTIRKTLDCLETFTFRNIVYSNAGTYDIYLPNYGQCDSQLHIIISRKIKVDTIKVEGLCNNLKTITVVTKNFGIDSFSIDTGKHYRAFRGFFNLQNGVYLIRIKKPCGILDTQVVVDEFSQKLVFYQATCSSYNFHNKVLKNSGVYTDTLYDQYSCDSIIELHLMVNHHDTTSISDTHCRNNPLKYYDSTFRNSGQYSYLLYNQFGCDSLVKINLTILENTSSLVYQTICHNQSYQGYSQAGIYWDTIKRTGKCDSIRELRLTVTDTTFSSFTKSICKNETYFFNGQNLSALGVYRDTLVNSKGCDSFIYLHLTRTAAYNFTNYQNICYGQSYKGYTSSGTYIDTFPTAKGCDSIVNLVLTVLPKPVSQVNYLEECTEIVFKNIVYKKSDTILDTLYNFLGCDSVYRRNYLKIRPAPTSLNPKNYIFCDSFRIGNHLYSFSFEYTDTIKTRDNLKCDSIYQKTSYILKRTNPMRIKATPDLDEYLKGESIDLESNLALHYLWNSADTVRKIRVVLQEDKSYYVVGWNDEECKDTAYIYLKAIDPAILDIPKAFSPIGMVENRIFKPNFNGKIEILKFEVYNRWGEKMYGTNSIMNIGWDGKYKGENVPSGVYSYILEYKANRNIYFKTGEVLLVW